MGAKVTDISETGDSLTPLRGIAACLVAVYHILENYPLLQARVSPASEVVAKFYLWVDFFFILSGYVIALAYGRKLTSPQSSHRFHFLFLRIARIYPLHLATLLAMILLDIAVALASNGSTAPFSLKSRSIGTIPSHLLLIHSIGIHDGLSWNMPSWSISCEWIAYIFFAFFARFLMNISRNATIVTLVSAVFGYFIFCQLRGDIATTYDFGVVRCLLGFVCGVSLFRLLGDKPGTDFGSGIVYLGSLLACVPGFLLVSVSDFDAFVIPFFVLLVAVMARPTAGVRRCTLECRAFRFLGEISYSLYMTHWILLASLPAVYSRLFHYDTRRGEGSLIFNLLTACSIFAGSLLVSIVTHRWIELPPRMLARQFFTSRVAVSK